MKAPPPQIPQDGEERGTATGPGGLHEKEVDTSVIVTVT